MDVAIVGMGLIGGSFFKAARAAGHHVAGCHHRDAVGWESAEIIVVCLPPEAIVPWIAEHSGTFRKGAVVIDICGVKRPIMDRVGELRSGEHCAGGVGWWFVGGHPMAGREVSGYDNSKADLFVGASMIVTPSDEVPAQVICRLKDFFATVGFHETVVTSPAKHDDMIAFTSQLCHVIATTYARDRRVRDAVGFSAGSYANMTRIATQDSAVWSALYQENRDALVGVLDAFAVRFRELRDAIAASDVESVRRIIDDGTKAKRDELLSRQRGDERV